MTSSAFDPANEELIIASRKEIVFIEDNVADIDALIKGIGSGKEVVILDSTGDGLHQVAQALAGRTGIDALHVITHGIEGAADFGALQLNGINTGAHGADLQAIGSSMAAGGDILLYGCNIGAGADGAGFLQQLAIATGADVAASNDLTGSAALGGDWELEIVSGSIETPVVVDAQTAALYQQVLLGIPNAPINFNTAGNFVATSFDTSKASTDTIYRVNGNSAYQLVIDGEDLGTSAYFDGTSANSYVTVAPNGAEDAVTIKFSAGQVFTATSISIANFLNPNFGYGDTQNLVIKGYDAAGHQVGATATQSVSYTPHVVTKVPIALTGMTGIASLKITASSNGNKVHYLVIDDLSLTNIEPPTPKILEVTSPTANGTYRVGDQIDVQVNFNGAVDVTGTPQLTLETGTTDRVVNYVSGTGTSSLTFRYTVQAGDVTADLDYKNTAIALNGGTIKTRSGTTDADVTLPVPGMLASLSQNKAIVVDGIAPTLAITTNKSLLGATGTPNDTAIITFNFSEDPGASFTGADVTVSGGTLGPINGSSGLTRTATFSQGVNGTATISVASGTYADAAGNVNQGSSSLSLTVDTVAPTVAISSNKPVVKAGDTAVITFTFSEDPGASFTWNGSVGDVVVSGGTLSGISGSGLTRTATFTPAAGLNGAAASITVNNKSYADTAGNPGAAGVSPSITVDTVRPTVSVSSDKPALMAGETATITFTFSEDPGASFNWDGSSGDVTVSGGTLSAISGSGITRTAIFTPNANTNSASATVSVLTSSFQDAAGNSNSAGGSTSITYDTLAPTLTIGRDKPSLKAGETATITFTFSENPGVSFDDSDIAFSGGTLSALSGSGTTRTAVFTPSANVDAGTASISVAGTKYADAAGNAGANANLSFSYDTLAPNAPTAPVLNSSDDSGDSNSDSITNKGTLNFSGTADPGATVRLYDTDGVTQVGSGIADAGGIWHIGTVSPLSSGSHTIKARAVDAAGNASTLVSGSAVVIDTTPPSVSITSGKTALKAGETTTITFTFSEDPGTSFSWDGSAGSVSVSGGTLSALSGSGTVRTATFTPTPGTDAGSANVSVAAGSYHDLAGNDGSAGNNLALSYDTLAPNTPSTPVLATGDDSGSSGSDGVTSASVLHFSGSADSGSTVKLYDGATELASTTASGGTWSIPLAGLGEGNHSIAAVAVDAAGNASAASASQLVVIDRTAPSTTIAGAALSADTGASDTDMLTREEVQTVSGTLSANLTAGERVMVSLDNGATWNQASASAGSNTWSLPATLAGSGTLKVQVVDLAGNGGSVYAHAYTLDKTAPGAPSAPDLDTASDSGSSHTDNITGVTRPGFSGTAETGSTVTLYDGAVVIGHGVAADGTWQIVSDGPLPAGTHSISAVAVDLAGNQSAASAALTVKVLTSGPATTVAGMALSADAGTAGDFITNQAAQTISGTLSGVLARGERVEVSTDGGTSWNTAASAVGSNAWSASAILANGTHDIKVRVVDAVDNPGTVYTQAYTVDSIKPAVSIGSDLSQLKAGETAVITFTFSEDPGTSFGGSDIAVSGGTLSALSGSGTTRTAVFTPDAGINGGTASIAVKADSYEDLAGNLGTAGTPPSLGFDTLAPSAASTPDLDKDSDKGSSNTDKLTNQTSLVFKGTAEAGATVKLYDSDGKTEIGSGTATGGSWTIAATISSEGSHTVTAKVTDAAGNVGAVSGPTTVTIDTTKPTLAIASDVSQLKIGRTANITFTFSEDPGTSFTDADVAVSGGTLSALSGTGSVRTATFTPAANTDNGTASISVGAGAYQDAAGNDGSAGAMPSLHFDTLAPAAPAAPSLNASSDTGNKGDGVTENSMPVIEGTALANTLVTLYELAGKAPVKIGTAMADASGKWSIATTLGIGVHTLSTTQTDAAGNESAASSAFLLRIMAPPVPVKVIDGMPVDVQPISLPGNVQGTAISIPVVGSGRVESDGQTGVADIPLVTSSGGGTLLLAQLAPGYGLSASGASVPAANAAEFLIASIKAATPAHAPADQGHLTGNGQSFLAGLASSSALVVETVKPVSSGTPSGVLTLSGPAAGAGQSTALVIDASGLGAGAAIALQQVNFAAVIGAGNVVAGSSMVLSGDGASQHFTIAAGGAGAVFAGGGSDILSVAATPAAGPAPAAGTALLHGGTANDAATFSGALADYKLEFHNGYVIVSSKTAPDAKTMVVNVEQLQFSDTSIAVQNNADMGTLAGIYQTVLGRQADVMGIEYWANVHQAGTSWGAIALSMLASNEHTTGHEGFNGVAAHDLALLYAGIFNREADAAGMAYWTAALGKGMTLEQVASSFVQSVEMVGHQRAAADWDFSVG